MALIANTFSDSVLDPGPDQAEWTEGVGTTSIRLGHYRNPTRPEEEILIDRTKTVTNQYGTVIREDVEYWQYDVPGAPPIFYEHETRANVFLPGLGRQLRKVEEEKQYFWAFSPWTDGDNLGRTRVVNAYVVYDLPEDPTASASAEGQANTQEKGMKPGTKRDRLVSSGKLWSAANLDNSIVEDATIAQTTKWVDGVVFEHDLVEEEFDKWTTWTLKKDSLRPGGVEWEGPKYTRKESYSYKLPVPMNPPVLSGSSVAGGVNLIAKGGGADINNTYFGPSGKFHVAPKQYYFYRRVVAEAERDADPDLAGWWETPPAAGGTRGILTDTDVTDYNGDPASALPIAATWDEPHDPDPEPLPIDAEFSRIGEVDNTNGKDDEGIATFLDTDVEDTAQYEYYATAVYETQESPPSNHIGITFNGSGRRNHRLIDRPDMLDAIAASDPAFPSDDFGEVVEFDVPFTPGDWEEIGDDIADRQFAMNRAADFIIRMTIIHPVLGLEWGQKVSLPNVAWDTYGNAIHLATQTDNDIWILTGFRRAVSRGSDGKFINPTTVLTLQERPRPQ